MSSNKKVYVPMAVDILHTGHLNIIENFRIESLLYFHRQLIDMSLVLHWKFIEIRLKYD